MPRHIRKQNAPATNFVPRFRPETAEKLIVRYPSTKNFGWPLVSKSFDERCEFTSTHLSKTLGRNAGGTIELSNT